MVRVLKGALYVSGKLFARTPSRKSHSDVSRQPQTYVVLHSYFVTKMFLWDFVLYEHLRQLFDQAQLTSLLLDTVLFSVPAVLASIAESAWFTMRTSCFIKFKVRSVLSTVKHNSSWKRGGYQARRRLNDLVEESKIAVLVQYTSKSRIIVHVESLFKTPIFGNCSKLAKKHELPLVMSHFFSKLFKSKVIVQN